LGPRPLDQTRDLQSPIGQALAEWRRDLTQDLGGPESITTAQAGMVELAVRTKLMLDSLDGFILTMDCPVNNTGRLLLNGTPHSAQPAAADHVNGAPARPVRELSATRL
jgi:hypothetical protein